MWAGCSSFVANEAHDAVLFRLLVQGIAIPAVRPLAHALVVVTTTVLAPDAIGVADEKGGDAVLLTEIHHLARALVAEIPDAALLAQGQFRPHPPQCPPTSQALGAAGTLASDLPQLLAMLARQGADTAPGDDQRIPLVGGHGGQMDLAEIDRRMAAGRLEAREVRGYRLGRRPATWERRPRYLRRSSAALSRNARGNSRPSGRRRFHPIP